MFSRERDYGGFLQTVTVNVGRLVGLGEDGDAYIVLRELPTLDMLRLRAAADKGEEAIMSILRELMPGMVADHNFFEDTKGQRKMTPEAVTELVFSSLELTAKVFDAYTSAAFLSRRRASGEA